MPEHVQTIVIGAGVVGLAIARALAMSGREVLLLERESAFGTITSARNSEVIHAGIYYPKDSLKARLCVAGRHMLYDYCAAHGVPHRRSGKLIVACSPDEVDAFAAIARRAWDNGVDDLREIDAAEARALEPALACHGALHSPSTGIVDSHALMLTLLGEAENAGAMLVMQTDVTALAATPDGFLRQDGRRRADGASGRRARELGRPRRPGAGARHAGIAGSGGAAAVDRQGQLFLAGRPRAVLAPDLSGAGRRRARHPPDARPRRARPLRPGRAVDRGGGLFRRPGARRALLRRDPPLLARPDGRRAGGRLCRHPAEAGADGQSRLPHRRRGGARAAAAMSASTASSRRA